MVKFQRVEHAHAGMNLAPLIDVIFILLVFFIITSEFKNNTLPLELPQSKAAEHPQPEKQPLLLAVDAGRKLALDGQALEFDALYDALLRAKREDPQLALSLAFDKNLIFEGALQVLAELQRAGVSRVHFQHETPGF
ncbi:MAG: biopolymer transporter ExbD [Spirochaetota bacterium]